MFLGIFPDHADMRLCRAAFLETQPSIELDGPVLSEDLKPERGLRFSSALHLLVEESRANTAPLKLGGNHDFAYIDVIGMVFY